MIQVKRSQDFGGSARLLNLPNAISAQEPVTLAQLTSQIEGLKWKDNVKTMGLTNINLASPGANIGGYNLNVNDRCLLNGQTDPSQNGIYYWNGASVPMTRTTASDTSIELENAIVTVDYGVSVGTTWRQTSVNFILGTDPVVFVPFGVIASPANTSSAGISRLATQSEADFGNGGDAVITSETLAGSALLSRKFAATIGDGVANQFVVTHNFGTRDVEVTIYYNGGNYDTVLAEVQRTTINSVTVITDPEIIPALNSLRVIVRK